MNPILNDRLVKKYFGCKYCNGSEWSGDCEQHVALRVLDAMCAPLKKEDQYLYIHTLPAREKVVMGEGGWDQIHCCWLRIPDEFQEPDYEKELAEAKENAICRCHPPRLIVDMIDLARKAERQTLLREQRGEMEREKTR